MFEDLEIQIYRFSPFLSSTLKLPRDGEREEGFALSLYFSYICIYLVTGFQAVASCFFTEKLSTRVDLDGTWSQQD